MSDETKITWEMAMAEVKRLEQSELYNITKDDWSIKISISLTEPVCPVVSIRPDGSNSVRYTHWGDTIEEALFKACRHVYLEKIEGKTIGHNAPWTNSDDRKEEENETGN